MHQLISLQVEIPEKKKTLDKNIATERSRKKNNKELCSLD